MRFLPKVCWLSPAIIAAAHIASAAVDHDGFDPIFDGHSLAGWETPELSYWSVEEGAITARITREHPCAVNQYLVWAKGELADFELKLDSRVNGEGAINNGFQFRSRLLPDHDICGYQVDNNLQTPWLVRLYEEFGRHTLAMRGERASFDAAGARTAARIDGAPETAWFRLEDWHEYHLSCIGTHITLRVNGQLAAEVEDKDPRRQAFQGVLGLQLHSGPPTDVQFKNIRLKILKPATAAPPPRLDATEKRRAALMAEALAWWKLDAGGHGAHPPLKHVPGWEKFELNRRADGPGANPGARVVLLDGAYFDAGADLHIEGERATVFLRARDPRGQWNSALIARQGGHDGVRLKLSGLDVTETAGPEIAFEVGTEAGGVKVSLPVSRIEASDWHDLVGRYDGHELAIFCDGRRTAAKPCRGALLQNGEPLLIGAEIDAGKAVRHFHGELEEAAIWTRALSDKEIVLLSGRR